MTEEGKKGYRRWTKREDEKLKSAVEAIGSPEDWNKVAEEHLRGHGRSPEQCQRRWHSVLREGLVKGAFTYEEDETITRAMHEGGLTWMQIAARIPGRVGKQCRERWTNHLDPNLKKGGWTQEEDVIMVEAQKRWGNAWTKIAELLPGRAENAVKNRWNSAFRRNNSSNFGKMQSEKTVLAIEHARAAMEEIDSQTQVNYRGNHSIAEVVPPQKHRPFLAKVKQQHEEHAATEIPPETPQSDGLDLLGLATEAEVRLKGEDECKELGDRMNQDQPSKRRKVDVAEAPNHMITAQEAMERFEQIRNHNQLKHLERVKVQRANCQVYAYDQDQVAKLAKTLDNPPLWSPPEGTMTMKMAMDTYREIRHRDQLKSLERQIVRRPTIGRAAACNVVVYSSSDVERLVKDSIAKPAQTKWKPPDGLITLQMAFDMYNIKSRKLLAGIPGTRKVRRPAIGRASGCDITVYPEDAVSRLASSTSASAAAEWRPPAGKLTTKMAMEKYPRQIRHHDQLRHLPKIKVRRPNTGRSAACQVVLYDEADVDALVDESAVGGGGEEWIPPDGKLTAGEAMKRYPKIRNHNQLKNLPRTKVRRPACGRASSCAVWVYEDQDVRALAETLEYSSSSSYSDVNKKVEDQFDMDIVDELDLAEIKRRQEEAATITEPVFDEYDALLAAAAQRDKANAKDFDDDDDIPVYGGPQDEQEIACS